MRKTTNLNDIRVFVAAEVGTFSAASANVELPVSTTTRSLTRLENISISCLLVQVSEDQHFLTPA
jgi:DNA-binding transcriptional LysR family regulator